MSWPTAQWNPGMSQMNPNMSMNMGSYTQEQWAAMQQQQVTWQQWAQWQQQYAQWQNQYGDKYAQLMQMMQPVMPVVPPPPVANPIAPPAPPPPDKPPPPPPPHENDQPLYSKPAPVPPPTMNQNQSVSTGSYNTVPQPTGNNQNWSYSTVLPTDSAAAKVQNSSDHPEALKKLAEEERLFDIQFQKWEEEIEKWKKDNVNHPDKNAYKEYQQKFESCRAQLLERRQQMKDKRARLLGNVSQNTGNIKSIPVNVPLSFNSSPSDNNFNKVMPINSNKESSVYKQESKQSLPNTYNNLQNNKNQTQNFDTQNKHDSYAMLHNENNYPLNNSDSNFLPSNNNTKGIPGLDLVIETDKTSQTRVDVIDITDEPDVPSQPKPTLPPDYTKISKGINSILGDEKIMNILSMVRGQMPLPNTSIAPPYSTNNLSVSNTPNQQWNQNLSNQNAFSNQQQQLTYSQRLDMLTNNIGPVSGYPPNRDESTVQRGNESRQPYVQQSLGHYDRNDQLQRQNIPLRGSTPVITNTAPTRPLMHDLSKPQIISDFSRSGLDNRNMYDNIPPVNALPPKPKWVEEPMFTPSIVVEYDHKPLRLKVRDFIEPVHTFDYNHISKEADKKIDFESEVDGLFSKESYRYDKEDNLLKYEQSKDEYIRENDRRSHRGDMRDDYNSRVAATRDDYDNRAPSNRDSYIDRRRPDDRFDDRRRDDRDRYDRRDDIRDRDRERDRDRYRDRRDDRRRSRSRDRDSRKRGKSREDDTTSFKKSKDHEVKPSPEVTRHMVMIDDILEPPGRELRPSKIVIILRGPPGSGKSYVAKLIRDREAEYGSTVRIMSIDDYYMQEGEIEEKDPTTGKIVKKPTLKYEYDESLEETYTNSLIRAFKRSISDGYFSFLIFDAVNDQLKSYADIWNFSRQNGFQVYVCTMELDAQTCYKRNIHNRTLEDIEVICARFFPTPAHHLHLDPTTLLQNAAITEVQMEDVSDDCVMEENSENEVENSFTSKWEKMDDINQLARLDGTSKPLRPSQLSMEDYLQLDDWKPTTAKPGKKTVRWADIEERRKQEKMRAIGFVVGQTDWNRMTDPTMGSSALTQTKYIERVKRF